MKPRARTGDDGIEGKRSASGKSKARKEGSRRERRVVEILERRLLLSTTPVVQSLLQQNTGTTAQPADTASYTFGGVTFGSDATTIAGLEAFLQGQSTGTSLTYSGNFSYLNQTLEGTLGLSVTTAGVTPQSVSITASEVKYSLSDADGTVVSLLDAGGAMTLDDSGGSTGLAGFVSGGFTLNVPGVDVDASTLELDFASSSIKLSGQLSSLTVGGEQFSGPSGSSFDFEQNGSDVSLAFAGAEADFGPAGSPVVTLSNLGGTFDASEAGVYGAVSGQVTLASGLGVSLSTTQMSLAVNTTGQQTPPLDLGDGQADTQLPASSDYIAAAVTGASLTVDAQQIGGSFFFEKDGSDVTLRLADGSLDLGTTTDPNIVSLTGINGSFTTTDGGLYGAVAGQVSVAPGYGVSLTATNMSLAINTTDAATPPLDLGSGTADTTLPTGPYVAVQATGIGLTIAGQTFTDPTTGGSFAFVKSGSDIDISFDGLADSFGGGLLNLSGINGDLTISDAGVKGFIGATPTFTTSDLTTSAQLELNIDTTVSPAQVTVSGQQVSISVDGQSLTANFTIQNATEDNANELEVGIDDLTAFFGSPDGSTGVSIKQGQGALIVTSTGVALDAGGQATLMGINGLQLSGSMDLQVNTTGASVDQQINVPGDSTPLELKVAADQPLVLEGTVSLTVDDSSGNAFITLSGGFAFMLQVQTENDTTTTTFDVGAAGVDAYVGSGSEDSGGVGVEVSDGTLGLVVIAQTNPTTQTTTSTYALNASGAAALVGLDGLDVSGTLTVQANNTGQAIDQTIDVPNPNYDSTQPTSATNSPTISDEVKFDTADNVLNFGGSVTISVANALTLSGTIDITHDQTTGGADISIPSASIALDSGGQQIVSLSGSADFTIDSTNGFKLTDAQLTDFSIFGIDAGASPVASQNSLVTADDSTTASTADSDSTGDSTEGQASTSQTIGLGPLLLQGPSVGLSNFQFSGGQLQVAVDVGVGTASLRFGAGNTGGTDQSSDQSSSGVSVVLTGVQGTFDLSAGFSGGTLTAAPTGAFTFSVGSLTATVPNVITIQAPSASDTSGNGAIQVNYNPADTNPADPLVTIQSADITIPKVGITGTILPYTSGGTTIPGLVITSEGLQLGQASITKTGPFSLGSMLTFQDLTVGISDFGVNFSGGVSFNGSLSLSSSGATLFPGDAVSASVAPATQGQPALSADFEFTNGQFSDLVFQAGTISVTLGTYLSLTASGVMIDTGAAGDASDVVAHFDSVGAEVKAGPLDLTGSAGDFDIMGDGSFHADDNFSVSLGVGTATGRTFQWPSWLPIQINSIGLSWPDLQDDPTDFVLSLSASVTGLEGLGGLTFSGEVQGIQIDLGKLEAQQFPIVGLGSLGVTVSGNLFGGQIDATLIGGILKIDQNNNILPADAPASEVKTSIFYAGLDGGFSFDGVGGINIELGLTQYGPLDVFLNATLPEGIVLDPDTGLAINDFTAGVSFYQTLPSLNTAKQLSTLTFGNPTTLTAATWLPDLQQQVVNQYVSTGGQGSFLSAFTSPMEIVGSAQIFSIYTSEQAFNGQVSVELSTDGKFAAQGKLNFGQSSPTSQPELSVSGTLYANLSQLSSGAATVLFLANAPDQVQLLTLEGSLKLGFTDDSGDPLTPGVPTTAPLNASVITPVTNTSFIDVEYEPAYGQTLDVSSFESGGQFTLTQNGQTIAVGTPIQVGQDIFEYPIEGNLTAGTASIQFTGGTWSDSAGNKGLGSSESFQVSNLGHAFYIEVDGTAFLEGADLATKLGIDPGELADNPIASITGTATFTINPDQGVATLSATGDMSIIGLGDVAQASANFVLDDSTPSDPVFYGAAVFTFGTTSLEKYGITANAEATFQINTSNTQQSVALSGVTLNNVQNPTISLDPQTAEVEATALVSLDLGAGGMQVFSVDGNFLLRIDPDQMDLFISGNVEIGPSGSPLFQLQGAAVLVVRTGLEGETPGVSGEIYLNRNADVPLDLTGVAFSGTIFAEFNTTEAPQGFELPQSFDSRLPTGFLPLLTANDQGYQANITAGAPNPDGSITAPQVYLAVTVEGDVVIENVLTLTGRIELTAGSSEFAVDGVISGTLADLGTIGGTISFNITSAGMWGAAELNLQSQDLPDASLNGQFVVSANTTNTAQSVPQYTINNQTGQITASGSTLLAPGLDVDFGGQMAFGGVFLAEGEFDFTLAPTELTATADAELLIDPIGEMHLDGDLQINSAGLVVYGNLSFDAGQSSLGSAYGLVVTGDFTFGVNSTGSAVTLDGNAVEPGIAVTAQGSVEFSNLASGSGLITFTASEDQLDLGFNLGFSVANVLNFDANGTATIYSGSDQGIVVGMAVTSSAGLPVGNIFTLGFDAGGTLLINTTDIPRSYGGISFDGITVGAINIPRDSFIANMSASLNLLGVLTLTGSVDVNVLDGGSVWSVDVPCTDPLALNFFNVGSLKAWGNFNSNGAFNFTFNGGLFLGDPNYFAIGGSGTLNVTNDPNDTGAPTGLSLSGSGSGGVYIANQQVVGGSFTVDYDSGSGDINATVGYTLIGYHTFNVYIGNLTEAPSIFLGGNLGSPQSFSGGVLYLNMGDELAQYRGFDANVTDENVDLFGGSNGPNGQTITVDMLGQEQTFQNVTEVVADGGSGDDQMQVDSSVLIPVDYDGGTGNNTLISYSPIGDTLSASGGTDIIDGGPGDDTINAGTGTFYISDGGGADTITLTPTGSSGSSYSITASGSSSLFVLPTGSGISYVLSGDGDGGVTLNAGQPGAEVVSYSGMSSLSVNAIGAGNTFLVRAVVPPTTLNTGYAANIQVGDASLGSGGTLASIGSSLQINGSSATLNVDDSGGAAGATGYLGPAMLSGLSPAPVGFEGLSAVNVALAGGQTLDLFGTPPGAPVFIDAAAADTINVSGNTSPATIQTGLGDDTINVQGTGAPLSIIDTGGQDTINIGSNAPYTGGTLSGIDGEVIVNGKGSDTLNLDDTGDAAAGTAIIASDTIGGLGMTGGVVYGGLDALRLSLGSGADTVLIATIGNPTATTVTGGAGNDQFNVISTGALTTIDASGKTDTVNVGSNAPATGGTLAAVQGELVVNGHSGDTLNVDDTGDLKPQSATIDSDQVTGLGMGQGGIVYNGIGNLNVSLGGGGNSVLLSDGGGAATVTLNTGAGNDTVNVADDSGANIVNTQAGNDQINITSTGGATTVNTGTGINTIDVGDALAAIQGPVTIIGDGGDNLNVSDTADSQAASGTLTPTTLIGFGMTAAGITYSGLANLNLKLGAGGNMLAIHDIDPATYTTVDGGSSSSDTVAATFAADFNGRLDLTSFEHGSVNVTNNFNGVLNDTAPGQLESVMIGGSLASAGVLNAGGVGNMNVAGDLAGTVQVAGTLGDLDVGGDLSGSVAESGIVQNLTIGGSLTPSGVIDAVNPDPAAINVMSVGGDLAGTVVVSDNIGELTVGGDDSGSVTESGTTDHLTIDGSLTPTGVINAGGINALSIGDDLAGNVNVAGTLADASVDADVSGNVNETGTINQFTVGGAVTATASIAASNAIPADANLYSLQVRGDMAGKITVTGTLSNASVGGDVSGSVNETGTIDQFTIGGSLTPTGTIKAINATPTAGNITSLSVGGALAGSVNASGAITNYLVGGDQSGSVVETGTINQATIGGSLTSTGLIKAVNSTPSLGNINALSIGNNLAGTVLVSGTLGSVTIVKGSFAPTGTISVGSLNTFDLGPNALSVGQNLAGNLTVTGTLGSVRVAGGTPGLITAGHIGTVAVYGGYGPMVARIIENGVERHIEMGTAANPYPQANPSLTVTGPYVNVQYFYESGALANPQLTARITNNVSTARDQYDLSLVTYSDTAKFNLARLDASGVAGVGNVDVEGDLLTSVTPQAAAFFKLANGSVDSTPAGIRLPLDNLAGVGIRDYAPNGEIQARSIQAIAFGSFSEGWWTLPGTDANSIEAAELLAWGTAIVQANDTFRVPFADQPQYQVGLYVATSPFGGQFDNDSINLTVEGVASPNATGTGNVIAQSNVARGADTALVTVTPTYDRWGHDLGSVVQSIAIRGDGASIQTGQYIANGITSTGPLGDLTLTSCQGVSNITAPSIFGSIISNGPITGTIQTTGLRTDPITGAVTNVPADLGNVYMVQRGRSWQVTSTVIQAQGGLIGQIISRGNLISAITVNGCTGGTIAAQGDLGAYATVAGKTTRQGGIVSNGTFAGELVVLGNTIGDITLNGQMCGGDIAVKGSIFGNLLVNGGLDGDSVIVAGGSIGSASNGTALTVHGRNAGIIAAIGAIRFAGGSPGGWVFANASTNATDSAAIDALFTNNGQPLALDINSGDLQGLNLITKDLLSLHVAKNGTLTGPTA